MSDQIDRNTMQVHKSVNTPDYPVEIFLNISGKALPKCDVKYWKIVGEIVVEMTAEEKGAVNYIEPTPEPSAEELAVEAETERKQKCKIDIALLYPDGDEMKIVRTVIAQEFPNNELAQEYNNNIEAILSKYPKV